MAIDLADLLSHQRDGLLRYRMVNAYDLRATVIAIAGFSAGPFAVEVDDNRQQHGVNFAMRNMQHPADGVCHAVYQPQPGGVKCHACHTGGIVHVGARRNVFSSLNTCGR